MIILFVYSSLTLLTVVRIISPIERLRRIGIRDHAGLYELEIKSELARMDRQIAVLQREKDALRSTINYLEARNPIEVEDTNLKLTGADYVAGTAIASKGNTFDATTFR